VLHLVLTLLAADPELAFLVKRSKRDCKQLSRHHLSLFSFIFKRCLVFSLGQNHKDQGSESGVISEAQKEQQEKFLKTHLLLHYINDFLLIISVSSH